MTAVSASLLSRAWRKIDAGADWNDLSGEMKPRGVRLETADASLIAFGSLGPDRRAPFRALYDQAVKSMGLSGPA